MTANGICKFCHKGVNIPDNLQGSLLRCPFCLRDFDVFESQSHAQNVQSSSAHIKAPELPDLTRLTTEFLRIRAAKKFATDLGCAFALLLAVALGILLFSESWLYFLLTILTAGIIFCGAWVMLIDRYFVRSIDNAFNSLFEESGISAPGNRELYIKFLANFSARLKVNEEKVLGDPFLRSILNRLADDLEKPQQQ